MQLTNSVDENAGGLLLIGHLSRLERTVVVKVLHEQVGASGHQSPNRFRLSVFGSGVKRRLKQRPSNN